MVLVAKACPTGCEFFQPLTQETIVVGSPCSTVTLCDEKVVISNALLEEMQQDSVECTTKVLEKYNIEKDIVTHIKKEFDKKYNPICLWIVGRNFGS